MGASCTHAVDHGVRHALTQLIKRMKMENMQDSEQRSFADTPSARVE
eukprot:SAG11_NODE_28037_length_326_cov_0.678414_1_plen_46_part_01